jgi:hypothetical protein
MRATRRSSPRHATHTPAPNAVPSTNAAMTVNSIAVACMKRNFTVSI